MVKLLLSNVLRQVKMLQRNVQMGIQIRIVLDNGLTGLTTGSSSPGHDVEVFL